MSKEYYEAHKAEIKTQQAEYRKAHKKEKAAYMQRYYELCGMEIKRRKSERYKADGSYVRAWMREYRVSNKEKVALSLRKQHLKRAYGMTTEEWETLFSKQGKKCAICSTTDPMKRGWHTDHDHATGKVRGIICRNCNLVLGHARDSVDILYAAIRYLEQ